MRIVLCWYSSFPIYFRENIVGGRRPITGLTRDARRTLSIFRSNKSFPCALLKRA